MTSLRPDLAILRPEAVAGGALHTTGGSSTSHIGRVNEQEWHQHAVRYIGLGMMPNVVAEMLGVHVNSVYSVQQELWFQEKVNRFMLENDKDVMEIFNNASVGAALKLVELMKSAKSESVQLAAAQELLDRKLGKAAQTITTDNTIRSADPVAEAEQLRQEIKMLQDKPAA